MESLAPYGFTPDHQGLLLALAPVLLAAIGAWAAGRLFGIRLEAWLEAQAPHLLNGFTGRVCWIVRYAGASVLLAAFTGLAPTVGAYGHIVLVAALGLGVALLVYQVARGLRLGPALAGVLATALCLAIVAGRLGGLDPLIGGLDRAAVSFGKSRLSLLDLLNFGLIAALLFGLVRLAFRIVDRSISNVQAFDLSQRVLFQKLANIGIVTIAFFVGVDVLGIDLTALAVFSGAFGLAVGFGFQKTFGNLISGLILLMDRSIKPGDVIVVGDTFGWVNKIGVRAVSVLTRDGKEHLIPNEKLMTEAVENWSYSDRNVRLHIPIRVAYDCDIHRARELMLEAARAAPRVLSTPPPVCWLAGFGESAVDHDLIIWIGDPEQGTGNVRSEVLTRVWDLFKENGIVVPYPQRDIHIRSSPRA